MYIILLYIIFYLHLGLINCYSSLYTPKDYIHMKHIKNIYRNNLLLNNIYLDNNTINNIDRYELSLEHVCPQSYTKNMIHAKNDMHNLFLTECYINSHRSNYKFIDELSIKNDVLIQQINKNNLDIIKRSEINNNLNYKSNLLRFFVPITQSRGKIARTISYMKLVYPKLNLKNIIDPEILINWDKLYPPLQDEIERNELIYNLQGNINPFIERILDIDLQ
jgi:endonuclease I